WYAAYILTPNRKQLSELNDIISNWIKNKSKMLSKYVKFQEDYTDGGLRAPILKNLMDARLVMMWKKLYTRASLWAEYERERISNKFREKRNIERAHLRAWKRVKGSIRATRNWPWDPNDLVVGELNGNQITVKKTAEALNKRPTSNTGR
ncbi:2400_t:CDS:2, partial [Gigaspora rosea]